MLYWLYIIISPLYKHTVCAAVCIIIMPYTYNTYTYKCMYIVPTWTKRLSRVTPKENGLDGLVTWWTITGRTHYILQLLLKPTQEVVYTCTCTCMHAFTGLNYALHVHVHVGGLGRMGGTVHVNWYGCVQVTQAVQSSRLASRGMSCCYT